MGHERNDAKYSCGGIKTSNDDDGFVFKQRKKMKRIAAVLFVMPVVVTTLLNMPITEVVLHQILNWLR